MKVTPDVIRCNAAISACKKGEQWADALRILGETVHDSVDPAEEHFDAAIGACDTAQRWAEALRVLNEMRCSSSFEQ